MIDHFAIFTKGGLVLWSYTQAKLKGSPIDTLVRTVLTEERGAENFFNVDQYTLRWSFANEFGLTFVVVYQKILQLLYIDELLELVKRKFCEQYRESLQSFTAILSQSIEFTDMFLKILTAMESKSEQKKKERVEKGPRKFEHTQKGKRVAENANGTNKKEETKENRSENVTEEANSAVEEENTPAGSENDAEEDETQRKIRQNIERLKQKTTQSKQQKDPKKPKPLKETTKKESRKWENTISKEEKESLDYSKKLGNSGQAANQTTPIERGQINLDDWDLSDEEEDKAEGGFFSFLKNKVQAISGMKPLEASDLAPVMDLFRQHIISKNVASEVAEKLCQSVQASLEGKKISTLQIKSTIKQAMEDALVKILTPKRNIDILREIQVAKSQSRPYVITFVGVNGVGKSTTLAKVCSWLLDKGHSVLVAACDTFRAGAVEQLLVHCKRLNVELFEKGYRTDPTIIAMDAIRSAKHTKDVVLIDTAGRMQDNERLMQALSTLVNTVKPDLVLFVGEAIVGNDAVDQLTKYNQALMDLSKDKTPRLIDGIILTKFDTIDDKVGAAISMVYTTGAPIVFLGVGQQYTDLRRMNVQVVTKALLKNA